MGIKIALGITEGWKATENSRLGEALEIKFINTENNSILFRYAPKLDDELVWKECFELLKEYDGALCLVKQITKKINNREYCCGN